MDAQQFDLQEFDTQQLLGVDVDSLTAGELGDVVCAVMAAQDRFNSLLWRVADRFARCGLWAADGASSPQAWIRDHADVSAGRASAAVLTGRRLAELPIVADAVEAGVINADRGRLIANAAKGNERLTALLVRDQQLLVDATSTAMCVDDAAIVVRKWRAEADVALAVEFAEHLRERRGVSLSQTFEGLWELAGTLDPEAGAILSTALQSVADQHYRLDDPEDRRTQPQLRADALVELARRGVARLNDDSIDGAGAVASLNVAVDLATLEARAGYGVAEDSGAELSAETIRRLACDADIARVITGPGDVPINLGRSARVPNRAMRRAIGRRDRGCRFPGCRRPPNWCDIHHLRFWGDGGPTDEDNLIMLCSFHHHLVHEGGFKLSGTASDPIFQRPDGTRIDTS